MRIYRNIFFLRILVILISVVLFTAAFAPGAGPSNRTIDYAGWLILHLPINENAPVKEALQRAVDGHARTFEDFLGEFLSELDGQESGYSASQWLLGKSIDNDQLVQQLDMRFRDRVDEAILGRVVSGISSAQTNASRDRPGSIQLAALYSTNTASVVRVRSKTVPLSVHFAGTHRHLWPSIQPMGP